MGIRLTGDENVTAMFDSVTGWAFGPVFNNTEAADSFREWAEARVNADLRTVSSVELSRIWDHYCTANGIPR